MQLWICGLKDFDVKTRTRPPGPQNCLGNVERNVVPSDVKIEMKQKRQMM